VSVVLDLDDRVVDVVADGYDCAVRFGEQADSALVRIRLADSPRVIVASPSYLARHARPRRPQDLSRHACLMLAEPGTGSTGRPWTLRLDGGVGTLRLAAAAICNDGAVLHDWALAGLGLAWRSWWEVGEDVAAGRLVTVLDDHAAPPTPIYAVFMARKHLPLRLRSFVDQLKAHFDTPEVQRAMQTPTARPRGGKSHA
jgi:DNA-binding transcriptional LysR family regulator